MKYLFTIPLLIGLLMQTFSRELVMVEFGINQAIIAREKCENRFKPELHCNGKCQLRKELKRDDKQEREGMNAKSKCEVYFEDVTAGLNMADYSTPTILFTVYTKEIAAPPVYPIFHPPTV